MKLSTLVAWLSKRFPEQLTVSVKEWTELRQEVAQLNVLYQNQVEIVKQFASLEAQVKKLNAAQGFVNTTNKGSFQLER